MLRAAWDLGPKEPEVLYDLACARSVQGDAKGALAYLERAVQAGFRSWSYVERDPDLNTLRADISYGQIHAHTTYGRIGVKVWIYRGDHVPERTAREAAPAAAGAV